MKYKTVSELSDELGLGRTAIWYWVNELAIGLRVGSANMVMLSESECDLIRAHSKKIQSMTGEKTSITSLMGELGLSRAGILYRMRALEIDKSTKRGSKTLFSTQEAEKIRRFGHDRK